VTEIYYAGIGSRQTPPEILAKMEEIGEYLAGKGWILRSGGAEGADKAFERGSDKLKKTLYSLDEVFLPSDYIPAWTNVFTDHFHPNPGALKDWGRKLMNRNAMQILGRDGNTPVTCVICWTKDGKGAGGTGQACRIADYYGIPVFDLKNDGMLEKLRGFVRRIK